jgi:hypothetical protein
MHRNEQASTTLRCESAQKWELGGNEIAGLAALANAKPKIGAFQFAIHGDQQIRNIFLRIDNL